MIFGLTTLDDALTKSSKQTRVAGGIHAVMKAMRSAANTLNYDHITARADRSSPDIAQLQFRLSADPFNIL